MKQSKTQLALALTATIAIGGLAGCTNSVPDASPVAKSPTGDVTGTLTDATTGEPVVGAVIMVEGMNISATTDSKGTYLLKDVPQDDGTTGYKVSIDTRSVTSPVNMADTTIKNRYADLDTSGNTLMLASLKLPNNSVGVGASGIVTTPANFTIGKGSGHIEGHVYDVDGTTALANVRVVLKQGTMVVASTTSSADNAATTDVNELGLFHFHNVEAGFNYTINAYVQDALKTQQITTTTNLQENEEFAADLVLNYGDGNGPLISDMSIDATGYDFASDATTVGVTFFFNEAIGADKMGYRDSTSAGGNLYEDIVVTYDGSKAGEVAKTVAWNSGTTKTALTVNVTTPKKGAKYTVNIAALGNSLEDMYGKKNGATYTSNHTTTFTVAAGGSAPSAPSVVAITSPVNLGAINATGSSVSLDWPGVSGASKYNIYRTATVGGTSMGAIRIASVTSSQSATADALNDTAAFGETAIAGGPWLLVTDANEAVSYTYTVSSVNADGKESAVSSATSAIADTVAPTTAATTVACTDGTAGTSSKGGTGDSILITFPEPMNKTDAETAANYTGLAASPSWIEYDIATHAVTVRYPDTTAGRSACTTGGADDSITPSSIKDVAGNAITGAAITY